MVAPGAIQRSTGGTNRKQTSDSDKRNCNPAAILQTPASGATTEDNPCLTLPTQDHPFFSLKKALATPIPRARFAKTVG